MARTMDGKRVLITHGDRFMGPASAEIFRREGAAVTVDSDELPSAQSCDRLVERASDIDVLIVNLASPNHYGKTVTEVDDACWREVFDLLFIRCIGWCAPHCRR